MTPYFDRDGITLYQGDCRAVLAQLEPESVSCVVTSPPFWGLRKYECEPTIWGGDPECPHRLEESGDPTAGGYAAGKWHWQNRGVSRQETPEAWVGEVQKRDTGKDGKGSRSWTNQQNLENRATEVAESATCSLCGCWRGWYGLEPTVEMYVEHTIEILGALRRVLRPDGTIWWDIDDSRSPVFHGKIVTDGTLPEMQRADPEGQQAGQGPLSSVLHEGGLSAEDGQPSPPGEREGASGNLVSTEQGDRAHQGRGKEQRPTSRDDNRLRRGVRLLPGERAEVSDARPRKRRRQPAPPSGEGGDAHDLPRASGEGLAARQLPDSMLELQSGEGSLSRLPTRHLPKSLALVPQRIAIAAQEDGWIVRSQVVIPTWMPESAKNRPTDAYRTVLMLTQTSKRTFFWNEKTRVHAARLPSERVWGQDFYWYAKFKTRGREIPGPEPSRRWQQLTALFRGKIVRRSYWHGEDYWYDWFAGRVAMKESSLERISQPDLDLQRGGAKQENEIFHQGGNSNRAAAMVRSLVDNGGMRNLGSVWDDIGPASYPDKHFAVMPLAEAERCITLSTPPAICRQCGVPRVRVVEKSNIREHPQREGRRDRNKADFNGEDYAERESGLGLAWDEKSTGWTSCACADYTSGVVLDPFAGTGTSLLAAQKLGRAAIGIELSEEYCQQAVTRLTVGDGGLRTMVKARRAGAEQATML